MSALVEAQGVGVRIGRHELLSDVDLALQPGEILSLIGGEYAAATAEAPALDLLRAAYSACGGRGSITLQLHPAQPVPVNS